MVLRLRDVTVRYGDAVAAVDHVSLDLAHIQSAKHNAQTTT